MAKKKFLNLKLASRNLVIVGGKMIDLGQKIVNEIESLIKTSDIYLEIEDVYIKIYHMHSLDGHCVAQYGVSIVHKPIPCVKRTKIAAHIKVLLDDLDIECVNVLSNTDGGSHSIDIILFYHDTESMKVTIQ